MSAREEIERLNELIKFIDGIDNIFKNLLDKDLSIKGKEKENKMYGYGFKYFSGVDGLTDGLISSASHVLHLEFKIENIKTIHDYFIWFDYKEQLVNVTFQYYK